MGTQSVNTKNSRRVEPTASHDSQLGAETQSERLNINHSFSEHQPQQTSALTLSESGRSPTIDDQASLTQITPINRQEIIQKNAIICLSIVIKGIFNKTVPNANAEDTLNLPTNTLIKHLVDQAKVLFDNPQNITPELMYLTSFRGPLATHARWAGYEPKEVIQCYLHSLKSFDLMLNYLLSVNKGSLSEAQLKAAKFFTFGCDYNYLSNKQGLNKEYYLIEALAREANLIAKGFDYQSNQLIDFLKTKNILPSGNNLVIGDVFCGEASFLRALNQARSRGEIVFGAAFGIDSQESVITTAKKLLGQTQDIHFYIQQFPSQPPSNSSIEKADFLHLSAPVIPSDNEKMSLFIKNLKDYTTPNSTIFIGFKMNCLELAIQNNHTNTHAKRFLSTLESTEGFQVEFMTLLDKKQQSVNANRLIADTFSSVIIIKRIPTDTSKRKLSQ